MVIQWISNVISGSGMKARTRKPHRDINGRLRLESLETRQLMATLVGAGPVASPPVEIVHHHRHGGHAVPHSRGGDDPAHHDVARHGAADDHGQRHGGQNAEDIVTVLASARQNRGNNESAGHDAIGDVAADHDSAEHDAADDHGQHHRGHRADDHIRS